MYLFNQLIQYIEHSGGENEKVENLRLPSEKENMLKSMWNCRNNDVRGVTTVTCKLKNH